VHNLSHTAAIGVPAILVITTPGRKFVNDGFDGARS
jgi:hypothetical protein